MDSHYLDRLFFERRPDRRYRVRRSFVGEVELAYGSAPPQLPPGHVHLTVVRRYVSGVHACLYASVPRDAPMDFIDEERSRVLWTMAAEAALSAMHRSRMH